SNVEINDDHVHPWVNTDMGSGSEDNIEYIQPSEPNVKKQGIIKKLVGDDAYSVDPKDKTHTIDNNNSS
ncbi:7226_t:CDS:2, partial [Entrophospora sp. SA101]